VLRGLVCRALAVQRRLCHFWLLEFQDGAAHHLRRFGGRHHRPERVTEAANGASVQLRDARLVDADLSANLLHRRLAVVVEADDLLLAGRQRGDGGTHPILGLLPLVGFVGLLGF